MIRLGPPSCVRFKPTKLRPTLRTGLLPILSSKDFCCRLLHSSSSRISKAPDFAFAFDIDGVLLRGHQALPKAGRVLSYLNEQRIPYILLTNGGGYHEELRAQRLTKELGVSIDTRTIIQSHTPFAELAALKDKNVLVVGGEYDNCRTVAERYGFKSIVTTSDIFTQHPSIWPFSKVFGQYHSEECRPRKLPTPINQTYLSSSLKIDAVFVYNDPRDWGLDIAVIIDCLLSKQGLIGTISENNNSATLPNRGFQQDGQPPLYFSNPDLWFASDFTLPRLGQGGFRWALEGVWSAVTGGPEANVELRKTMIGKPYHTTYQFAERRLNEIQRDMFGDVKHQHLNTVFMIGDNPESDIKGASTYCSASGSNWLSALVKTGVYSGGIPSVKPTVIVDDVFEAARWALETANWHDKIQ